MESIKPDVTSLYSRRNNHRWDRVSIGDIWERVTHSYPDKEAIVGWKGAFAHPGNARLTYRQADEKANQFANALIERGLSRGDRVLFFCENSVEAFVAKIAVAKAGMVVIPINVMIAPDVISYMINLVEPSFSMVDAQFWPKVASVFAANNLRVDVTIPIEGEVVPESQSFEEFTADQPKSEPDVEIHGDDIWEILFTSGTTSMPKGVMISHTYTYMAGYSWALSLSRGLSIECDLKMCTFLPFIYHSADQDFVPPAFLTGGTLIIGRKYNSQALAEAITQEHVTALWAGSSSFLKELTEIFWKGKDTYDPSSLTVIAHAFSPLSPEYANQLKEMCGEGLVLFEFVAQTEAIAGTRFWIDKWPDTYKNNAHVNYVGVPSPILSMEIVDEHGNFIHEPRIVGEAVYRSPVMLSGYYKDEEATQKAFQNGWFHSGDGLMYDENGLAIMVDRVKDIIKSGGENVSTIRVETVLKQHPAVEKAAVIGLPHEKWDEVVTGVVVLKKGQSEAGEELIRFCRERLAGFETPKQIIFLDDIPESVGGKVMKYRLREQLKKSLQKE
jgi:acyl-CoA synthetase (AMP-forming)/AMP-acid ligase II